MASTSSHHKSTPSSICRSSSKSTKQHIQLQLPSPSLRAHPEFNEEDSEEDDREELLPPCKRKACLEDPKTKSQRLTSEGIALAVDGKFSQALKQFNEAIYLCPTPELFEMKAQALMETFQYFPAIQAAEMAVKLKPSWGPGLLTLGRAQLNYGEFHLAKETLVLAKKCADDTEARDSATEDLCYVRQLIERQGDNQHPCRNLQDGSSVMPIANPCKGSVQKQAKEENEEEEEEGEDEDVQDERNEINICRQ